MQFIINFFFNLEKVYIFFLFIKWKIRQILLVGVSFSRNGNIMYSQITKLIKKIKEVIMTLMF